MMEKTELEKYTLETLKIIFSKKNNLLIDLRPYRRLSSEEKAIKYRSIHCTLWNRCSNGFDGIVEIHNSRNKFIKNIIAFKEFAFITDTSRCLIPNEYTSDYFICDDYQKLFDYLSFSSIKKDDDKEIIDDE